MVGSRWIGARIGAMFSESEGLVAGGRIEEWHMGRKSG